MKFRCSECGSIIEANEKSLVYCNQCDDYVVSALHCELKDQRIADFSQPMLQFISDMGFNPQRMTDMEVFLCMQGLVVVDPNLFPKLIPTVRHSPF